MAINGRSRTIASDVFDVENFWDSVFGAENFPNLKSDHPVRKVFGAET